MKIEIEEPVPVPHALALTFLRLVTGAILAAHGLLKLSDFPSWQAQVTQLGIPLPEVAAPLAVAGEFLGGLGLMVGLFTRVAAFGGVCVMAVAIAYVHARAGLFMRNGGFEFPLMLGAASALFAVVGGGRISLDRWRRVRAHHRAIAEDRRWSYPPYVPSPSSVPPTHYELPGPNERALNPGYRE